MKLWAASILAWAACGGVCYAQTQPTLVTDTGYVSLAGHSAFGNVTSRSLALEAGWTLTPELQVVAEVGRVLDTASSDIGAGAQTIVAALAARSSGGAGYTVKAPVNFGTVAHKYLIPMNAPVQLYLLGGGGIGEAVRDVSFTVAGVDVTNSLTNYHIVLGNDLSGSLLRPMIVLGVGVDVPIGNRLFVDLNYRYNRLFDPNIPISRAGAGVGVRF